MRTTTQPLIFNLPAVRTLKITAVFAYLLIASAYSNPARAVTFDWATIGNPGNADDIHDEGYGGVDYTYRISRYEVTNAQYAEFLNAVDPTGTNPDLGGGDGFLYSASMSSDANGGINLNGSSVNGSKYEIKPGQDNNPVIFVSFFDAMRFTNWLHNGQGSGDTESGVYTIGSGLDEVRSPNAAYFIPSEDEWYKAAYYDPSGVYYDYPTGTNVEPYSDNPSSLNTPDNTNVANFYKNDGIANGYNGGWAVTNSIAIDDNQNYYTDVGAYSLAASPYGTFDQGGNVFEWNETVTVFDSTNRSVRGGAVVTQSSRLRSDWRLNSYSAEAEVIIVGFRVASVVPEPSTVLLGAVTCLGLLLVRPRYYA